MNGETPISQPNPRRACAWDVELLAILVCPLTGAALQFDREHCELISRPARLAYPIRDGIAILLPAQARTLRAEEIK